MNLLLSFVVTVSAALYRQPFDIATVANGTSNALLTDGARISGTAVVSDGELVLTERRQSRDGAFHVPALNSSSLGWAMSFGLRMVGGSTSADGVWALWGNVFNVATDHNFRPLAGNASFSFLSWFVDTFQNSASLGNTAGFFITNSTGLRSRPASLVVETLLPSQQLNATVLIAWNPQRGATFRTNGFSTDANLTDVGIVHIGNDSHTWSIAAQTGQYSEFAAIDNLVIDAPCGDCSAGGGECVWHAGGRFECELPSALQFVNATQTGGYGFSTAALGMDFTVHSAIDVIAIGLLDADDRGISGTLVASIFDRSTDRVAAGPVTVRGGAARWRHESVCVQSGTDRAPAAGRVHPFVGRFHERSIHQCIRGCGCERQRRGADYRVGGWRRRVDGVGGQHHERDALVWCHVSVHCRARSAAATSAGARVCRL